MYVAYSLKSVVGLLYELLLSVLYRSFMHTPQTTRKRYVYFLNQILIFLVLFIVDATVFILLGVGLGVIAFNFE